MAKKPKTQVINEPSEDSVCSTPLRLAVESGNEGFVEFLLELGAKVDQKDILTGDTILHFVARSSYPEQNIRILEVILEHCVDVNIENNQKETPLMIVTKEKNEPFARLLLQHKAEALKEKTQDNSLCLVS